VGRLGRKWLLLDVLRCRACGLDFRYPLDTPEDSAAYYEREYRSAAATQFPAPDELGAMAARDFRDTPWDLESRIRVLRALAPKGRVLDYGCSWGYGTYQLRAHGYDAVGYEIAASRAHFGQVHLGFPVLTSPAELEKLPAGGFDAVFTNHVLEHLTTLAAVLDTFARLLASSGVAVHFLPNFAGAKARSGLFWRWIGEAHPIAPNEAFFRRNLPRHGFRAVCASSPFDEACLERLRRGETDFDCDGDELLVVAYKQ
jgi:SAM-dependent methyltransferase